MSLITMLGMAGVFRNAGMALVFPFPEGVLGIGARIGLALALSAPYLRFSSEVPAFSAIQILEELLLGALSGAPILIMYHGVRVWGDLIESLRGQNIGVLIDPHSGGEVQPFAVLMSQMTLMLLSVGILFPLLVRMQTVLFDAVPPNLIEFSAVITSADQTARASIEALRALFCAALPFALIVIVVECAVAIASKVGQGVSLSGESYLWRMVAMYFAIIGFADPLLLQFTRLIEILVPVH